MKRFLLLAMLCVLTLSSSAQITMSAYISEEASIEMTNILNKPMGATVLRLPTDGIYIVNLTSPQDGWWKIMELWTVEDDATALLTGSDTGEYWIHYSVLGVGTRNYGGQCLVLRDAPSEDANVVYGFTDELELMPMDVDGDWVKVKVDGYDIEGWIEAEWLCSNPVTNCC